MNEFLRLPAHERALVVQAAALSVMFRFALWFAPFSRVRRLTARLGRGRARHAHESPRIGWAVEGVGRRLPWVDCLPQALAAFVLLSRSGYTASVRVGVARTERFAAHAWVEANGVAVVGGAEKARFTEATGADLIAARGARWA